MGFLHRPVVLVFFRICPKSPGKNTFSFSVIKLSLIPLNKSHSPSQNKNLIGKNREVISTNKINFGNPAVMASALDP
jgi:hypothetical protein